MELRPYGDPIRLEEGLGYNERECEEHNRSATEMEGKTFLKFPKNTPKMRGPIKQWKVISSKSADESLFLAHWELPYRKQKTIDPLYTFFFTTDVCSVI